MVVYSLMNAAFMLEIKKRIKSNRIVRASNYTTLRGIQFLRGIFQAQSKFKEGGNYNWIYEYLNQNKAENAFIIEVGSRDALDAISLTREFSPSECFVFEPTRPGICRCIESLSRSSVGEKIILLPFALLGKQHAGNSLGIVEFNEYIAGNIGASSLYKWHTDFHSDLDPDKGRELREQVEKVYKVPASSLDELSFLFEKRTFLLAIDVEGAELEVLSGGVNLLRSVDYVCVETGFNQPRQNVPRDAARQILNFMNSVGFDLVAVNDGSTMLPSDDGLMKQFDLLFSRRSSY